MKFLILLTAWLQTSYPSSNKTLKEEAFIILNTKCNVCHAKRNPTMVFTKANMDQRARKIKLQVFILKRMPKDNATRLSDEEKRTLKKWIEAI